MWVKKLPDKLVERLKAHAPTIAVMRRGMKVLDHRYPWTKKSHVHQMNVSRNFPGVELAIKMLHNYGSAEDTIRKVKEKVREHNKEYRKPEGYVLLEPEAYAIGPHLVAMAKIDAPCVTEILLNPTERGKRFFRQLQAEYGVSERQLRSMANLVCSHAQFEWRDLVLLGIEGKSFVFVPFIDLY